MFKWLIITFNLSCSLLSNAQLPFLKTYNFGSVEYIYQIIEYDERVFINTSTWCGSECSFLSEVDFDGNILWRVEVLDIDIAQGTMIIVNDTITITGNEDHNNKSFLMAHFTLNGEKIGNTFIIEHPSKKFSDMFQLTTQYYNNRFVVCGVGKLMEDAHYALMYIVDNNGILDTLITLNKSSYRSEIWDSYIDSQGLLTIFSLFEEDDTDTNYRKIYKFNENYDTVWSFRTENFVTDFTIPRGCELMDGRTILACINPEGDSYLYSVRAINPEGSLDWQYDYQWTGSKNRVIYRLKTLQNGDIMGSGQYSEFEENPEVSDSPWLFRMNADGVLLWEHVYYEFDSTLGQNGSSRIGAILDFTETDNGDILAVGVFNYDNSDMLIMRVDSNGCLFEENCEDANVITGSKEIPIIQNMISIYPNPATDYLNIEIETRKALLRFEIQDVDGVIQLEGVIKEGKCQVNVSNFGEGIYFIRVIDQNQSMQVSKFVKLKS